MIMTLSRYITEIGDRAAGDLFGVSERTAASWRRGERCPRADKAHEIERITDGKVSFAGCFAKPDMVAA
jgi:DNA-binding transcriptional regulator YdaS (Cro superfamily)